MYTHLYLASQSPRRQELLQQMGLRYQLLIADANEDVEALETQIPNESSLTYVRRVTLAKLSASIKRLQTRQLPWAPILCADTTVSIQVDGTEEILGKPLNDEDAIRILKLLSGQTHQVHTAIALQKESKIKSTPGSGLIDAINIEAVSSKQQIFILSLKIIFIYRLIHHILNDETH